MSIPLSADLFTPPPQVDIPIVGSEIGDFTLVCRQMTTAERLKVLYAQDNADASGVHLSLVVGWKEVFQSGPDGQPVAVEFTQQRLGTLLVRFPTVATAVIMALLDHFEGQRSKQDESLKN